MRQTQDKKAEMVFHGQAGKEREDCEYADILRLFKIVRFTRDSPLLIDTGCGSGSFGIMLAKRGYTVVGLDISSRLIKLANKRFKAERANFFPVLGDIEKNPFRSKTFDVCFCGFMLHHFRKMHHVVRELSRILKRRGKIYLAEPNGSNPLAKLKNVCGHKFFPEKFLMKAGIATPNETLHTIKSYFRALETSGFDDIRVFSTFWDRKQDPLMMRTLNKILWKILPQPYRGTDVSIRAKKLNSLP